MDMLLLRESTRIERVILLHQEFLLRRELTTQEMAERFSVSQRTIQRDISAMAHVLPIYPDNGRWVYIQDAAPIEISPY